MQLHTRARFKKLLQEKRMTEATLNTDEKPKIKSDKDIAERLLSLAGKPVYDL